MKRLVRPLGPEGRGISGSLIFGRGDPLGTLTRWAREYGDIFYYRSFHRHIYVLNSPELIKTVLVTNYKNFTKGNISKIKQRVLGNGLLMSEGDFWLQQRRLIQPSFHHSKIEGYGQIMVAYTERMMEGWHDGDARDMYREIMHLAMEIVAKAIFGVDLTDEVNRISAAVDAINSENTDGRFIRPFARFLPTDSNRRHERAARELDDVVYGLIKTRRASGERGDDLLSALLATRGEDGAFMPDKQLRDEVMTLLLAGYETTAISLSWAFYLLGKNPDVEEKLHSELMQILGCRNPNATDYAQLQYTQAVIKETMRLYPPAWLVIRSALQDCELGGYQIPGGSVILMSQWLTHRDPRYYVEPKRFNPARWLDKQATENLKMAYFPFGGGPRGCIGASFAMLETVLVLATIEQRFRVALAAGFETEPAPTLVLRPKDGVKVVLAERHISLDERTQ